MVGSQSAQQSDGSVSVSDLLCVYCTILIIFVFKHRETVQRYWCDICWLYCGAGGDGCGEKRRKGLHNAASLY